MKIGIIVKDFLKKRGGGERYSATLSSELVKKGHDVTVFARKFDEEDKADNIQKIVVPASRFSLSRSSSFASSVHDEIKRINSMDVVYGLTQIYSCDLLRLGGGLIVFWEQLKYKNKRLKRFLSFANYLNKKLEKRILFSKTLKSVVVNSEMCRKQLIKYYDFDEKNIKLIRNGVDSDYFSVSSINDVKETDFFTKIKDFSKKHLTILFISNNYQRKGLNEILHFMSQSNKEIRLIVSGRGNIDHYKTFCSEKKIEDRVFFTGFCEDIRMLFYYSDIFVLPTYYDPFANVCLEAASFGLPVVTTLTNGFSELIKNGKNGFILEHPEDQINLKKAFEVFSKRKSHEDINIDCRNSVIHLTPSKNAEETIELFEKFKM